jgi:HAD superfamily hydrolase (TIGR01509 family)
MPHVATAIFDFDGTIADTLPLIYAAFDAAISPSLGRSLSQREVRQLFGPPDHEIIRSVIPVEHHDEAIASYVEIYEKEHEALASIYAGMDRLLHQCRTQGIKVGIVTGKSRKTAEISLRALGLGDAFDVLIAGDDVERPKPHPEGVFAALRAVDHREGTVAVYVGDSAADVYAGRSAGLKTIAITWGSPDHDELMASNPDIVCQTVSELAGALGIDWD